MTRSRKVLLALLIVVLLSQAPFAYRRYKLRRLNAAIQEVQLRRETPANDSGFAEFKGVVHVHSSLGGHSKGSLEGIIAAARATQLDFVGMTEHTSANFNTAAMSLKGTHAGILFINGNEVSTVSNERLLILPGDESASDNSGLPTPQLVAKEKSRGALSFVAYPQDFKSWEAAYDGIEVYNLYTNVQQINPWLMFFDGLWSYRGYPDLLFANFYSRPDAALQKWDELMVTTRRRISAIAGNDAHANVGFSVNDASGKILVGGQLDPYERSFRLVRVHALIPRGQTLGFETLLKALGEGHFFIGFDLFGDTSGFAFTASDGRSTRIQGDEIPLAPEVRLTVKMPVSGRILLFRDGTVVKDQDGINTLEFIARERGVYRVEAYMSQLPNPISERPWIISNPIYVR